MIVTPIAEPCTDAASAGRFAPVAAPRGGSATLVAQFRRAAERFGARTALRSGEQKLSYAELDDRSSEAAAGLRQAGVQAGDRVAILMERSPDMIVAMLAVLKAGAAYLPIDPRYPEARIQQTLEDATPALVLVSGGSRHAGICLGELNSAVPLEDCVTDVEATAYIIYTSGSTGVPKGVEVTHGNVAALLHAGTALFGFDEHDVWTMFHSFAFDFSVWEIWGCLLTGGQLVLVPFEVSRSPEDFRALLATERVTVLNQTPCAFALLDRADDAPGLSPLHLRLILFGGEALNGFALRGWLARHGDQHPQLVNMYGITETTVHVTHRRMMLADAAEHESLIGDAIPGWQVHVLDEHLQPVAAGMEGELRVGGAGVAKGYLQRPELTRERFVTLPGEKGRLYRSGDMARVRADGELVYLGRRDGQVKVNGFRIETAEVESALLRCAGVQQACVAVREGRLIAWVVSQTTANTTDLSGALATQLPAHMLPSRYVAVGRLPLSSNGKIDRAALPEPPLIDTRRAGGNAMEQRVAAAWAAVLGADVSYDDNFFDVGGTSVLLVAVRSALAGQLGRSIPVTWMFECTTIRSLAQRLEGNATQIATAVSANAQRQRQAFARARAARAGRSAR